MQISALRVLKFVGSTPIEGELHQEPIGRPQDIYPHCRPEGRRGQPPRTALPGTTQRRGQVFLRVETTAGLYGQVGPVEPVEVALLACRVLGPRLIGQDPRAGTMLWDLMDRSFAHGRTGIGLHAIGCIDCALWDLRGRWLNEPVCRLLGGPTRPRIEAYAQTKGMSHHPDHLPGQVRRLVESGWTRLKLFLNHGPADGVAGMRENHRVVRTAREAAGEDVELAVDVWRSWDMPYAMRMLKTLAAYNLAWAEQPLRPDLVAESARLRRRCGIPISGGEHHGNRFEVRTLLDGDAVDILQPDIVWCGGISEAVRILALASTEGVAVYPHTHLLEPTLHWLGGVSPGEAPLCEYPVFEDTCPAAWLLACPSRAAAGAINLPQGPGLGMELDEGRIESQVELEACTRSKG